ncbi:DUF1440 domain-containing protein [Sphingomonas sp.]|uniref:DUF1440 domain-containing protein n=1 Tax=Sphingomonas sp. TaxID=28214 RepID=UPI002583D7D0|nr:DUF1440 domain-containing protein [Sphingomonas sp.]
MSRDQQQSVTSRLLGGALAGLVGGLTASAAMDAFQAGIAALSKNRGSQGDGEPATVKAADSIAKSTIGHDIADGDKPLAGQAVHYALGAALGVAYGMAAAVRPGVTKGYGVAFGLTTATVLDEAAVPAAGLGDAPWRSPLSSHAYGVASHLVFGTVTEMVRRRVAAGLTPKR